MLIVSALILCMLALFLWGLALTRQALPDAPAAPPPRDPVAEEIDKMMHDWDRGRA